MRAFASAASVAITVLATLVVAAIGYAGTVGWHPHLASSDVHPVPPATPTPIASPVTETPRPIVPPRLLRIDEDVDETTAWMLVSNCQIAQTCQYSVARSTDSGRNWLAEVSVGPSFAGSDGDAPRRIRFQNLNDGFVYGVSGVYVTHDGGRAWQSLDVQAAAVYGVAVTSDRVWVTTRPCAKGTACPLEVRSSADSGRSWSVPHQLPEGFTPEEPVAFRDGLIMSSVPAGDIIMTTDAGVSWRSLKSACTDDPFRGFATTVDGLELWEACGGQLDANGAMSSKSLFVSEDGGKTWSPRDPKPLAQLPLVLVPGRTGEAFVANYSASMVTRDAGKTWSDLTKDGVKFWSLRFRSVNRGWALDRFNSLYETVDGGDTWTLIGELPASLS